MSRAEPNVPPPLDPAFCFLSARELLALVLQAAKAKAGELKERAAGAAEEAKERASAAGQAISERAGEVAESGMLPAGNQRRKGEPMGLQAWHLGGCCWGGTGSF